MNKEVFVPAKLAVNTKLMEDVIQAELMGTSDLAGKLDAIVLEDDDIIGG